MSKEWMLANCTVASKSQSCLHTQGSEFFFREAATIIIVDAIPALSITVRPVLSITALRVAEALCPALGVTHGHHLRARWVARFCARDPALASLTPCIPGAEPTLLLTLFGAPDPVGA